MARLLLGALAQAGFAPRVASSLRTREPHGHRTTQAEIRAQSLAEADRLACAYAELPAEARPRLWFTYHCYYKAPDHLGPAMARRLGLPYVIAEASRAPKRADGPWGLAHEAAEAAIQAADALLVMTAHDRECLEPAVRPGQRLVLMPPFIDTQSGDRFEARPAADAPRLLAVAMMRHGDKLASYRLLATALARLDDLRWTLDLVGDGPARDHVSMLFRRFGGRVRFHGIQDGPALADLYARADVLVWPAVNEAYGMVLLEAQGQGCPVVAGRFGGVPDVVLAGETGLLATPGDPDDFARCVKALLSDPVARTRMGEAGRRFVEGQRSVDNAATILRETLMPLIDVLART